MKIEIPIAKLAGSWFYDYGVLEEDVVVVRVDGDEGHSGTRWEPPDPGCIWLEEIIKTPDYIDNDKHFFSMVRDWIDEHQDWVMETVTDNMPTPPDPKDYGLYID